METSTLVFLILRMFGALALLVFGMKQMSETLQKMAGPQLRHILGRMTTNRFTGLLTGVMVTAAVQSSTATTVMTVSFVNAELLSLAQAISVIMGANIGTTLTAWIMSAGFSFNITDLVWPAFVIALILIYRKRNKNVGDFLFGIAFMFLGLGTLRQTGIDMNLGEQPAVLNFFSSFDPNSFSTTILFLLIGGILTMSVQSSAAVMAITMILCSSGVLPIYQGIALVMGENIGTTVTSNLAALTASTQARRAALAHMFFNLFGVCWILTILHPFIDFVCGTVGYDVTMTRASVDHETFLANAAKLSVVLAAFHTCFNVANTFLLIWFIPQIERLVCAVIKDKTVEEGQEEPGAVRLQYINAGLVQTPEIAVLQAQKEVGVFAKQIQDLFGDVRMLFVLTDEKEFNQAYKRVEDGEDHSDRTELEIARFLEQVSDEHLSDETKAKIRQMLRQISEIESIGDACYNLARTMERMRTSKDKLNEGQINDVKHMMRLADEALTQMNRVMNNHSDISDSSELKVTRRIEHEINSLRDRLKANNISAINEREYNYATGTTFTDLVCECEKLGDYVVNVVEARYGK
ncbi:MAG: Na/Pi cotransporter family protein [Muribaculaceae bacterium]|nr:Na/Pi cotransporter family protein [Muribaculaceae bacterium]